MAKDNQLNEKRVVDIGVIGSGIGASSWIYFLKKYLPKSRITQISSDFYPNCSHSSTAIVTSHGIRPGVSSLGDLLYDSYRFFEQASKNWDGVYKGVHTHLCSEEKIKRFSHLSKSDQFEGAFNEDCFYINNEELLFHFSKAKDEKVKATVESISQSEKKVCVILQDKTKREFDYLFSASSFWLSTDERKLQVVQGSFLSLDENLGDKSFSYTRNGFNFIYKHFSHKILFGSLDRKVSNFTFDQNNLLNQFKDAYSFFLRREAKLDSIKFFIGLRSKAPKRMPFTKKDQRIFEINGLYKNGWSVAPYLTNQILANWSKE